MVSLKSLLTCVAIPLLTTAQPIDPPTSNTLEPRGYGWLEGNLGREAYRCEYWTNPFFDKIHLAGRNSSHTEKEIKDAAKEAGAVTGWKWEDMGGGVFDVRFNLPLWGHNWLEHTLEDAIHVSRLCASDP